MKITSQLDLDAAVGVAVCPRGADLSVPLQVRLDARSDTTAF